jgi:hypothetical protein
MDIYPIHEAFVYKWTNTETNKIYIGKHKGTPDDGYISSGKAFMAAYLTDPTKFERTIIWQGTNTECLRKESEFIKEAVEHVGWNGLYNLTNWRSIQPHKRTCPHCGKFWDTRNQEWADQFESRHFENCIDNPTRLSEQLVLKEKELFKLQTELNLLSAQIQYKQLAYNTLTQEISQLHNTIKTTHSSHMPKNSGRTVVLNEELKSKLELTNDKKERQLLKILYELIIKDNPRYDSEITRLKLKLSKFF